MIPMFCAIWVMSRHGREAAIIAALIWGAMDFADNIINATTGRTIVEHVLQVDA